MIILNVLEGVISCQIDNEIFSKTHSENTFTELSKLADIANNATTVEDYKKAVIVFKDACQEEIGGYLGTFHDDIFIDNKTGEFYLKYNGKISAVPMPETMVNRIKESIDKKIDISPLLKAWIRFLRNPKCRPDSLLWDGKESSFAQRFFNFIDIKFTNHDLASKLMDEKGYSEEVANKMATTYSMKLSQEGLLAGFKVSEEITTRYKLNEKGEKESYNVYNTGNKSIDPISGLVTTEKVELVNEDRVFRPAVMKDGGSAFFCGDKEGHIIRVGQVHKLSAWDKVNCNDNQSCCAGLHVGGLDYIRGYQGQNTETHNTLICPSKIGAIPDDSTGAMRVLEYFTLDAFSGVNGSIYHSSKYGSKVDSEWADEKAEILKKFGEYKAKQDRGFSDVIDGVSGL